MGPQPREFFRSFSVPVLQEAWAFSQFFRSLSDRNGKFSVGRKASTRIRTEIFRCDHRLAIKILKRGTENFWNGTENLELAARGLDLSNIVLGPVGQTGMDGVGRGPVYLP